MNRRLRVLGPTLVVFFPVVACLMLASCHLAAPGVNARATKAGKSTRFKPLPKGTVEKITREHERMWPWKGAPPVQIGLRRRLFEFEERLMAEDKRVRSSTVLTDSGLTQASSEQLDEKLQLAITGPEEFICGEQPGIRVVMKNLMRREIRLCLWKQSFRFEFVHSTGQVPKGPLPLRSLRLIPRDEDYATIPARGAVSVIVALPCQPFLLEPGRYHLSVSYCPIEADREELQVPSHGAVYVLSDVVAIQGVEADAIGSLKCSLMAPTPEPPIGEGLKFIVRLQNTSRTRYLMVNRPYAGLLFRNKATDQTREVHGSFAGALVREVPSDGFAPHYRRASDYVNLSQGEILGMEMTLPWSALSQHEGFIMPGQSYEVTARYTNSQSWHINRDGSISRWGGTWIGRIASKPVEIRFVERAEQ